MSNVVDFHARTGVRILIESGILSRTVIESSRGTEQVVYPPGLRWYFVDVVEPEGRQQIWDGSSYAQAKEAAGKCLLDWGNAVIVDRVRS